MIFQKACKPGIKEGKVGRGTIVLSHKTHKNAKAASQLSRIMMHFHIISSQSLELKVAPETCSFHYTFPQTLTQNFTVSKDKYFNTKGMCPS